MKTDRLDSAAGKPFTAPVWFEFAGLAALTGLTVFFLSISWRKWPDPLIDFGDQLYTAWRLSQGAVLYRDVDLLYGPLSQYFNALLFTIFGPGVMVLVAANLAVFGAILAVLYLLCRRAWGVLAALVAGAIFVAVFGFSQFVHWGNLNYATPYAHETTHGMLICLLLCLILVRAAGNLTISRSFLAGGLLGLTTVLKPEFMLAGGLVTVVAGLVAWRSDGWPEARAISAWLTGLLLPTAAFALWFMRWMPWKTALAAACRGWLNAVATTSFSGDFLQMGFLGLDQPGKHFIEHALATLLACLIIGALALAIWLGEKIERPWWLFLLCALTAAGFGCLASAFINWIEVGRCLLGLMLIYTSVSFLSLWRTKQGQDFRVRLLRTLLAVLATALMTRMLLHGRIYQYGYYQAALAGVIPPAVLLAELPAWLKAGARGRAVAIIGTVALLLPCIVILANLSQRHLRLKTTVVGTGRDWFYAFPRTIDPAGEIVGEVSEVLRKTSSGEPLLVLPEGEMINYLARLPNPIPEFFFFSGVTSNSREEQIVEELEHSPPYWIVIISRDLGEYGIDRYGEKPGSGEEILRWVDENFKQVANIGGDPLDYREHGALLLRKYHYP